MGGGESGGQGRGASAREGDNTLKTSYLRKRQRKKNTHKKDISDFGPFSYGYGEGKNIYKDIGTFCSSSHSEFDVHDNNVLVFV